MKRDRRSNRPPRDRHRPSAGGSAGATIAAKATESRWLLAAAIGLFVARPFVPGVAIAQEGHGAVFVLLWLLLLAAWLIDRLRRFQKAAPAPLTLNWIDAGVLSFVVLYAVSGVVGALRGSPRPAVNMTWHWLSVGIAYFLFRQLLATNIVRRAAIGVLIGLAVAMAVMGLEQAWISLPDARAEYLRYKDDPQQLYERTGQWLPLGSAVRMQFESRLETAEPAATFALSNSLAALLVPALVLLVGIVADGRTIGGATALAAILVACLVLTHSRSGMVAAVLAGFVAGILQSKRPAVWLVCGGAIASLGGLGLYFLQREAFDAAVRSFAYRLEYWQSTWAMIQDYPLFGCGPGQFQDVYTAFKLPAASEEVADPHNFLLEVWSTGGSLAMATLAASLIAVAWRTCCTAAPALRNGATISQNGSRDERASRDDSAAANLHRYVYVGASSGVVLGAAAAWLDGVALSGFYTLLALASLAATLAILHRWVLSGRIPRRLPAVAAGGMLLHLCVSGGIGEPALASVLWLLVVLQIGQLSDSAPYVLSRAPTHRRRIVTASATALAVVFVGASYLTYYRPVLLASGRLASADLAAVAGERERRLNSIEAAVAADPWSIEAARRLAAAEFAVWETAPTAESSATWQQADEHARRVAPRRHSNWRESGERYAALFRRTGDKDALDRAIEFAGQAVVLYPTNADHLLSYAEILSEAGRTEPAQDALAAAIQFDRAKQEAGHDDRALSPDRLQMLRELAIALDVPF